MATTPEYGPLLDDDEFEAHARTIGLSFNYPPDQIGKSLDRVGREKIRVLRRDGQVAGGLTLYPMGQWFFGKRIDMIGVNLVGIAPEFRGGGVATELMEHSVREMRDSGAPISVLYPAKQTLYRRVGYELAGGRYMNEIDLKDLELRGARELRIRSVTDADEDAVRALAAEIGSSSHGQIDRPDYMWRRITSPVGREVNGYLVEGDDGPVGFTYVEQTGSPGLGYDLQLLEFVAVTPDAARRLLRFLGDHASVGLKVRWYGDPADPALMVVREQTWKTSVVFRWMLRVLDPVTAFEKRGWPRGLEGAVDLELADATLPENVGRWRLEVSGGEARVTPGGDGSLRTDARGLASMYTGYLSPVAAKRAGLVEGDADALARATPLFAGPTAWISDMF